MADTTEDTRMHDNPIPLAVPYRDPTPAAALAHTSEPAAALVATILERLVAAGRWSVLAALRVEHRPRTEAVRA
jgi:hypothetical protein